MRYRALHISLSKIAMFFRSVSVFLLAYSGLASAANIASTNICFDNPNNYQSPAVYYWNPDPSGVLDQVAWPGRQMREVEGFYCLDLGVELSQLELVFSDSGFPQSGNLQIAAGNTCLQNGEWTTLLNCGLRDQAIANRVDRAGVFYFRNDAGYAQPTLHFFDMDPNRPESIWPGVAMSELGGGWYSIDFGEDFVSGRVVLSDSGGGQSDDLTILASRRCFQSNQFVTIDECDLAISPNPDPQYNPPQGRAIYFVNGPAWQNPTAYLWNEVPAGSVAENGWPGVAMTELGGGNLWYIDIGELTSQGKIIFSSNGQMQSDDMDYQAPDLCFNNGVWMTYEQCGVPQSPAQAQAGPDRRINQGSRLALSAAATQGEVDRARWTSDAWNGELEGESAVTPRLDTLGSFTVTLKLDNGSEDTFALEVVAANQGLAERPLLATPLAFPASGSVASGNYEFESAFPNLDGMFISPVMVTNDGVNDLIYVLDKPGTLTVFANDRFVEPDETTLLLDIRDEVRDYHEQGLISMVVHPRFADNGFVYIYYVEGDRDVEDDNGIYGDTVLERITLNDTQYPSGVVEDSRVEILRLAQPGPDHKGGKMAFHPASGLFYMSIGDGAYGASALTPMGDDPRTNNSAQDTSNLLGTFIRLEMLDTPVDGMYYRIPSDNPFVGDPSIRDEIWSYGHRNPWRWAFDAVAPYRLWATEVGQSGFEEVNLIERGKNYGWPICEGLIHRGDVGGDPGFARSCDGDLVGPVEGYQHGSSPLAIVGGHVYRGNMLTELNGRFIFGDYVNKRLWTMVKGEEKELLSNGFPGNIASFGTDLYGDEILISTHGLQYGGGVSGIFRVVDRQAQTAVIPSKLSKTGLFADLKEQFPASGVIEYEVNSSAWFDGAKIRRFLSVPNDESMVFKAAEMWSLPVGSVLVKHIDIPVSAEQNIPFETSVLFRQENGWEAANYRWNAEASDADLVRTNESVLVQQYFEGQSINVERSVLPGSDCASCHTGNGSKNPRNFVTRQLNRSANYQGVRDSQLSVFDAIGLFDKAIEAPENYPAFVNPEDISQDINERARTYLDTNCTSCHSGTFMDMRYDTALVDTGIMNQSVGANLYRMRPFDHARSVIYTFQTSDTNRMPRGSSITNPMAEALFRNWIDAADAQRVGADVRVETTPDDIRLGARVNFEAVALFNNGFELPPTNSVSWSSSSTAVFDLASQTNFRITAVPESEGLVTVSAMFDGQSASVELDVLGGPNAPAYLAANSLSSSTISLSWQDESNDEIAFTIGRAESSAGPFEEIVRLNPGIETYVDFGLLPSRRYYYEVRAISEEGPSVPATAFAETLAAGDTDALLIASGDDFQLLAGESRQLVAIGERDGECFSATLSAVWASSNNDIVQVSAGGVVLGGDTAGTADITASLDGQVASIQIVNLGRGQYVYFNNNSTNWDSVRIHVFSTSNGVETSHTQWPGDAMEASVEYGGKWLRYAVVEAMQGERTEVIFNCGSAECQTLDLEFDPARSTWFENVNAEDWLAEKPRGGGAVLEGTQVVVGRGTLTWANNGDNLSGTLLTPGALLDIVADDPGTGQSFTKWEGTAAPYLLDPSSPRTKILIPNTLSLTINAVFDSVTDEYAQARDLFRSNDLGCSACHGADGLGSPPLSAVAGKYNQTQLAQYISDYMPKNNASDCVGECAERLAQMILAEAFFPPAGVCDRDSLDDIVPKERAFRLLSVYEYNNSVRDLLGLTEDVDVTSDNLPADIPVNGFKTGADTVFTDDYAQGYINAASAVAELANNSLVQAAVNVDASCASSPDCLIREFAKHVYRRPLSSQEVSDLRELQNRDGDRAVLITLFSSPSMLYRSEVGELITSGSETGYYQLSDHEVAALLSYTYWGTTPDAALIAAADAGELSSDQQIRDTVANMLADPRAEAAFERFVLGWLNLEKDISTNALSEDLKRDMKEETLRFVSSIVFGGGRYQDLITANYSYMTERLAAHYGLPWPGGNGWQQVFYQGENSERRGVLGHASVLAIQSAQEKTHPVKRGLFVRRNLMCQDFPPPPLGAALDPVSDPAQGVRHRYETSHAQPGCEACHQYIDGIGFGLESYNALGQFTLTETTDNGSVLPIDANGYIGSLNSAETFLSESEPVVEYTGLDQLSELIADSSNAKACFARQWFRYARGRREAPEDSCTLQDFGRQFKADDDATLMDLLIQYTQTKNFTLRK